MSHFKGFFRTIPQRKKVRGWVRTRGRNWVRTLIHGLGRLMQSPWRSTTTSLRRSRSRRQRWRRVQRLALQLAFGLCGSAHGSSHRVGGVPMAKGAPSHTHGLSFTRKQPMKNNSPRAFLTEAVEVASGSGGVAGEGGERKAAWCSCAEDRGPPCALLRQVPAVLRVCSDRSSPEGGTFQLRRRDSASSRLGAVLGFWRRNGGKGEAAGGFVCLLAGVGAHR